MDIIIHGKPLDASERFTTGVDQGLARKIIGEFFTIGIGTIKEPEALVVDARYWQGIWTSVYTLLLKVEDRARRPSYFAISLVLPQKYCCLISEVYELLAKIVLKNVRGVYLNTNGQYVVSNFEDTIAFERLCTQLRSDYQNLEKEFDSSFQPQPVLSNNVYYNIQDCDSLAFVNQLKTKGRIIVTENAKTKDALALQSTKYYEAAQKAQGELQTKESRISELESRISQMENETKQANSRTSGTVSSLKSRVAELESTNKQLLEDKNGQQKVLKELDNLINQASDILGVPKQVQRVATPNRKKRPGQSVEVPEKISIRRLLPAINTVLILLIVLGLFMNAKGCSDDNNIAQDAQTQVESLKTALFQKEQEISDKEDSIAELRRDYSELNAQFEEYKNAITNLQTQMKSSSNKAAPNSKNVAPQKQTSKVPPKPEQSESPKADEPVKQ